MTKVLHITNWYPNLWNSLETQFIKELYNSVPSSIEQEIWHIQVRHEGSSFRLYRGSYSDNEHYIILDTKIHSWRLTELLTLGLLIFMRVKLGFRNWELVNVHIAYPLLRFPRLFQFLFGRAVVISEHWSAYKSNFHLKDGSRAKRRMQNIFAYGIPVIAVSEALTKDIEEFSDNSTFPQYVIPNTVDPTLFYPPKIKELTDSKVFLMASAWAPIKRPLLILNAFMALLKVEPNLKLKVIGYGEQWQAIEEFVERNNLAESILLLGSRSKNEIAQEMRMAAVFIHASDYETFSVVCAEALCSGLPVIASNVGGIVEFVDDTNGILVENNKESWFAALSEFVEPGRPWDPKKISEIATERFSPNSVGQQIVQVYKECISRG